MKYIKVILVGILSGSISWAVSGFLTGQFEPFDSGIGFLSNQIILCAFSIYYAYKNGLMVLVVYLFSAYLGINTYAYVFGGSEQQAWFLLLLISSVIFLVLPFVLGLVAKGMDMWRKAKGLNENF